MTADSVCNVLLDHNGFDVRACVREHGHKEPHFPGPWRAPTREEVERLRAARREAVR